MRITTKFSLLLVGLALAPVWGIAAPGSLSQSEYERIQTERNHAPTFTEQEMDQDAEEFLAEVRATWEPESHERRDSTFSKVARLLDVEESVDSVVTLYTHKTPDYAPDDPQRNAKEALIAAALTIALPVSADNLIYTKEGLAFFKVSDSCVFVFEDTDWGLISSVYMKSASGEKEE